MKAALFIKIAFFINKSKSKRALRIKVCCATTCGRKGGTQYQRGPRPQVSEGSEGKVLKMDGPSAQGFLSLTGPLAPRVADCRYAAMLIKSALRDWLSVPYVTQYPVPPIFSFPLEGKSREAGKGVRGRAPIGCSIAVLTANRRPPSTTSWSPSPRRAVGGKFEGRGTPPP